MDIYGRHADSPAGEYFWASIWAWRPIHALIRELCSDILDDETLARMEHNDGYGPEDQDECCDMASRFEQWVERNVQGLELPGGKVTKDGRYVSEEELAANPDVETESLYRVEDEHLRKWVEFLRIAGDSRYGRRCRGSAVNTDLQCGPGIGRLPTSCPRRHSEPAHEPGPTSGDRSMYRMTCKQSVATVPTTCEQVRHSVSWPTATVCLSSKSLMRERIALPTRRPWRLRSPMDSVV